MLRFRGLLGRSLREKLRLRLLFRCKRSGDRLRCPARGRGDGFTVHGDDPCFLPVEHGIPDVGSVDSKSFGDVLCPEGLPRVAEHPEQNFQLDGARQL